ncbi:conjugal transfer protein TraP [Morganella morganii]|nr:hypothetical protein [Salmonella enterica subsp. enterica serovar Hadar]
MTNEFCTVETEDETTEEITSPVASKRKQGTPSFLSKKIFLGLTLPWLAGFSAMFIAFCIYLFAPDDTDTQTLQTSVDGQSQYADSDFSESFIEQSALSDRKGKEPIAYAESHVMTAHTAGTDIAIGSEVKAYAEANREAITKLSNTVTAQNKTLAILGEQYVQSQSELAGIKTRLAELELGRITEKPPKSPVRKTADKNNAKGMSLASIQNGMAWIQYQGKTWAVQEGDRIGSVIVTEIDAAGRQVMTSGGIVR